MWVKMKHENHINMSRRKPLLMIMISLCRCPVCRVSVSAQCCRSSISLWSGYIPLADMFILLAYINNCQLRNKYLKKKFIMFVLVCVLSLNKESTKGYNNLNRIKKIMIIKNWKIYVFFLFSTKIVAFKVLVLESVEDVWRQTRTTYTHLSLHTHTHTHTHTHILIYVMETYICTNCHVSCLFISLLKLQFVQLR